MAKAHGKLQKGFVVALALLGLAVLTAGAGTCLWSRREVLAAWAIERVAEAALDRSRLPEGLKGRAAGDVRRLASLLRAGRLQSEDRRRLRKVDGMLKEAARDRELSVEEVEAALWELEELLAAAESRT